MKIVFLTPTHQSSARGNTVTVNRWAHGLRQRGHEVIVLENDEVAMIAAMQPDILHAHHAVHCGPTAIQLMASLPGTAVVVSLGGTDLHNEALELATEARESLTAAHAIVGPFSEDGEKLRGLLPSAGPFHTVPRGIALRAGARPATLDAPLHGVILGGIRAVKGQLSALRLQTELKNRGVEIRLSFAGPVIERSYGRAFEEACREAPEAEWLGTLDSAEAAALVDTGDFLLNTSASEGASNAILEALAAGRAVCARRVPGNQEMLAKAPPGCAHLIQDGEEELDTLAAWLRDLADADADSVFSLARDFVSRYNNADAELDALIRVYDGLTC